MGYCRCMYVRIYFLQTQNLFTTKICGYTYIPKKIFHSSPKIFCHKKLCTPQYKIFLDIYTLLQDSAECSQSWHPRIQSTRGPTEMSPPDNSRGHLVCRRDPSLPAERPLPFLPGVGRPVSSGSDHLSHGVSGVCQGLQRTG